MPQGAVYPVLKRAGVFAPHVFRLMRAPLVRLAVRAQNFVGGITKRMSGSGRKADVARDAPKGRL